MEELELIKKQKEEADKRLLNAEVVIGLFGSIFFLAMIFIASFVEMPTWLRIILIVVGCIEIALAVLFCVKIEQVAGYYECAKCHHKHIPTYKQSLLSMHMGRTKYMKCPKCGEKSWQKKVLK